MVSRAVWARELSGRLLADALPDRWAHTRSVAAQARDLGPVLGWDTDLIEAAGWLHDIGYAPTLRVSGFHPLDGARYLRDVEHAERTLCVLVAHHTGAEIEAAERGLADALVAEFPLTDPTDTALITALTYCDMTTGPRGQRLSPEQRIAEILTRYEPGSAVHRAVSRSAPALLERCRAVTDAVSVSRGT